MVLAFLPVVPRLGVDISPESAVVMVVVVVVVTVVVVGVVGLLVVPMIRRRVMHMCRFVAVMTGMMSPSMAARETLSGVKAHGRRYNGTGEEI